MTQRIFDATNEQDVKDLFGLLPNHINSISRKGDHVNILKEDGFVRVCMSYIKIKWNDLTEIKRPVDYSEYIGKFGWFNTTENDGMYGVLNDISKGMFWVKGRSNECYAHFRPLTLEEIKEKGLV